jgi:hypothetical protein
MIKIAVGRAKPITLLQIFYPSLTAARNAVADLVNDPILSHKNSQDQIKMLSERLREGWTAEQAFGFEPPPPWAIKGYAHPILCAGTSYKSERDMARAYNIPHKILHQRLHRDKMSAEAAVNLEPPAKYRDTLETVVGCIYLLTHRATGKCYVGLTVDESRRLWQHFASDRLLTRKAGTIQDAIATHGRVAFDLEILESNIPGPQLAARERHWIKQIGSLKPRGYNQNAGGVVGGYGAPVFVDDVKYLGLSRVADEFGITLSCLVGRLKLGWSLEEAVNLKDRTPKTRTPINLDLGGRVLHFPSAARARRELGLGKRELIWRRYKLNQSWDDAIRAAIVSKIRAQDAEEGIICIQGGRRRQSIGQNSALGTPAPVPPNGQAA